MTSPAAAILATVRVVLLDFDGPVCSVFAGYPAPEVAASLLALLDRAELPSSVAATDDPLDVLRWTAGRPEHRIIEDALQAAELRAAATAEPTPGCAEFLAACRATGRTVAIVSNNSDAAIRTYLQQHGLAQYVAAIHGRHADSPELMKPHPHVVQLPVAALEVRPSACVLIGDSVSDIQASHAADVRVIAYANKPGKHKAFTAAGADAVITDMHELFSQLRRVEQ